MLAVGTKDRRVILVDPATGEVRWEAQKRESASIDPNEWERRETLRATISVVDYMEVAISSDGQLVAGVSGGSEFWELWEAASGELKMTGASHDGTGTCKCQVAASGLRQSVDSKCAVRAHRGGIVSVALSPCGKIATAGLDGAVILWDAGSGQAEHVMKGFFEPLPDSRGHGYPISVSFCKKLSSVVVDRVQFSRSDSRMLVCVEHPMGEPPEDVVVRWDLTGDHGEPSLMLRVDMSWCSELSTDGRAILCCDHDRAVLELLITIELGPHVSSLAWGRDWV